MQRSIRLALVVGLLASSSLSAAVFIVPDDSELVGKSARIVTGVIESATPVLRDDGDIETVYELRVERALKGGLRPGSVIEIVSPGGTVDRRWVAVPGSAHFKKDDHVLLFLVEQRGHWTTTDMTLGKFRFVTSSGGQSLLVRDEEDIVGFDKEMRTHVERVRREEGFLKFITDTVRGRKGNDGYFLSPEEAVSLSPKDRGQRDISANAFTAASYSLTFGGIPARWPESRMTALISQPFFKNSAQSASGLGDGGVQMITDSLNAWVTDCGSYVNLNYAGTSPNLKDTDDNINVVVWNDPGGNIGGNWTGSGVVATAFLAGDNLHTFDGMVDGWVSISDVDVVVQNGLTGAETFVDTAMVHEIGHGLGLRHSNTHWDNTGCQVTDECTGSAIMNSSVVEAFGYTIQPWDINGIRAFYPTSCVSAPLPPTNVTIFNTTATTVSLSWSASNTATSYKVYRRTAPGAYAFLANVPVGTSYVDDPVTTGGAYQYVVHAVNAGGESGDSNSDWTTAIAFTDNMASGLTIKLVHVTQLQAAVNALRTLAGLSAFSFTSAPTLGGTVTKAHIDELLAALNAARTDPDLGAAPVSLGETLVAGTTTIQATHLTALRNGVF